jgi:tRNA-dihydrouridine synthase B
LVAIGPYTLRNPVVLAPMAGVTDLPFRELVWELGAGLVVAEMTSVNPQLWSTRTSLLRRERGAVRPRVVQIAGADPALVATAASLAAAAGAEIVDVNMGCPAKKVCNQAAGSALLRDEALVARILRAAVAAVNVPVTVKIRTGWAPDQRNGVTIAKVAQDAGVASIAVHGRTRACRFVGAVEYDTIAAIKAAVTIPVFANGDIGSAAKARAVLAYTGADGVLIGRAALGAPWLPGDIAAALAGAPVSLRSPEQVLAIVSRHLARMHAFYGAQQGVRIARKHGKAYLQNLGISSVSIQAFNAHATPDGQLASIDGLRNAQTQARAA